MGGGKEEEGEGKRRKGEGKRRKGEGKRRKGEEKRRKRGGRYYISSSHPVLAHTRKRVWWHKPESLDVLQTLIITNEITE